MRMPSALASLPVTCPDEPAVNHDSVTRDRAMRADGFPSAAGDKRLYCEGVPHMEAGGSVARRHCDAKSLRIARGRFGWMIQSIVNV